MNGSVILILFFSYLIMAVLVALIVLAWIRKTRTSNEKLSIEMLRLQQNSNRLLEEFITLQRETNRLLEQFITAEKAVQEK